MIIPLLTKEGLREVVGWVGRARKTLRFLDVVVREANTDIVVFANRNLVVFTFGRCRPSSYYS